jgi:hypothetical protein
MRCLYCGKELALLKRWTGGGEFCSDAHRQRYQEEYNQLALNRLLQAKPPTKDGPADDDAKPAKTLVVAEAVKESVPYSSPAEGGSLRISEGTRSKPAYYEPPAPVVVRETKLEVTDLVAPRVPEPEPEPVQAQIAPPEEPAPAEASGFIVEMPGLALAEVAPMSRPDLEFLEAVTAALPNRVTELLNLEPYRLETAGLVTFEPSTGASNSGSSRERKLEVRDFVRIAPVVEIDLSPVGETGLETTSEAMDILISPQPPQGSPALWQEAHVGFPGVATELGALARLAFPTTGLAGEPESDGEVAVAEMPEAPPVAAEVFPELPEPPIETLSEPEPIVEAVIEQVVEPPVEEVVEPVVEEVVEQPAAQIPEPQVEPEPEPEAKPVALPEPVTKSLPISLHATAPGKGKPVQVFSSAANAVAAQVPRSTSLPLRPLMTFGPAPAGAKTETKKAETKPEFKKPAAAPVRPDPRLVRVQEDGKPAQKVPVIEPPKEAAKQVAAKWPVKADAKADNKPEAKEPVKLKEDSKAAPAPYSASADLGLPQLNLQSSSGFLGNVPILAKVGIVVVLLAGLGGLIAYSSKSGGAATTAGGGSIVAGSALPAGEAGWITDWGAQPGVRSTRQISILRSSQTLTDYRIEMNAQIESKAIGWVFRAQDPKNFYVTKLEIVKPGLEPTVALVRFAIINGEEQAHAQLPLPMKVSLDTMYKIRFDAVGDHFTTYVQDQKVDDWTDAHIKTGGVGFYRERGEDATLKGGMNVVPLIVRK